MINVLPPENKSQLKYARLNSRLLRYLVIELGVMVGLVGLLYLSLGYGDKQIESYQNVLAAKSRQKAVYQELETNVNKLQSNLSLINSLLNEKTKYSSLLDDLAATLPVNSFITQMTLNGDDSKAMDITVSTDSFQRAAEVRNGLIQSERIASADIQSVSRNENSGSFTVELVVGFAKGAAR